MQSDAELVAAVLSGNRGVFADLVSRYDRAVRATALAVVRHHHTAQDVAQDAFVAAYEKLGTLRDASAFGAWLLQIARYRAMRAVQSGPRTESLGDRDLQAGPERDGHLDTAFQRLLAAVARLPEQEQRAVMLHYFAGNRVADIAAMNGHAIGTVTSQLARARARLREWLKEFGP